jgi:hypothetical protein
MRVARRVVEDVRVPLPEALVEVHAGPRFAVQRLGQERGREAEFEGGHAYRVLDEHHGVGRAERRQERDLDLALPGPADLVVVV